MSFQSYQASEQAIEKTEYGIPIRNIWHMLIYAWNDLKLHQVGNMKGVEDAPSLDAMLSLILMKLIQQRLRVGLGRNYVNEKQLLRGIRGRICFSESIKNQTFERNQAYCEFQQFSIDVPKNQIVYSTLVRLIQVGRFGPNKAEADSIRHNLRILVRTLDGITLVDLKPELFHRQQLGRNDSDYRLMLAICELILMRMMPFESSGFNKLTELDRDALVLHHIYELFVSNFYRINLTGWIVSPQKHLEWHETNVNIYLPIMKPDLVMEEKPSKRIITLDTKFTAGSLSQDQFSNFGFNSGHLYQLYTYLKTQEHLSNIHKHATGILLYPCVNQRSLSESIELQDIIMRIETVDLTAPWQIIEKQLLNFVLA
jgi:5-methylcytosine-specific restriction enzyme subunit McrC